VAKCGFAKLILKDTFALNKQKCIIVT